MRYKVYYAVLAVLLLHSSYVRSQASFFNSFDTIKIAYTDEGRGAPVILLHGFINSGSSWNNSVLKKELLKKGYRVITPDLRGNGLSEKPHRPEAYKNNAEIKDIMALADHLKLKKYNVVGYSRGSIVLAKLVTMDHRIKKAVFGGMGIDFTNPNWERRIMFSKAFGGHSTPDTEGAVAYAKSINADLTGLHLAQEYQPVTSKGELGKIRAKVLVISGKDDTDNGSPSELQNAIPNSTLVLVAGNHNDTYKNSFFSEAILQFFKQKRIKK